MVGDRKREALAATIRDVTDKAGVLVVTALTISVAALFIGLAAFIGVLKLHKAAA